MVKIDQRALEDTLLVSGFCLDAPEAEPSNRAAVRSALADLRRQGLLPASNGGADPVDAYSALIEDGRTDERSFWQSHLVRTGRRLVERLCGAEGHGPPDLAALPPRRFELTFRRSFNLKRCRGSHARLRLPLPIEDAQLTDLVIEEATPGLRATPGRFEAKIVLDGRETETIGARLSFTAAPQPQPVGPTPDARWLRPNEEGAPLVTEAVRSLAAALDPGGDDLSRLLRFRDHLIDRCTCALVAYERLAGQAPADWVIANGHCDCRLGALLLVALCRASGIPARLIGGYLLWEAPSEHFWMEAWIEGRGWTPVDLLMWGMSTGGRDAGWRSLYLGALDYRAKTQILPDTFLGSPGVPIPADWRLLMRRVAGGAVTKLVSGSDGQMIYEDDIRISRA